MNAPSEADATTSAPPEALDAGPDGLGVTSAPLRQVVPIRPVAPLSAAEGEVARQLQICNACRYCEGFCAVFPAMTRRLEFARADVHYLANLCHNCGACLHACQYAPPHEFAVNVPRSMAEVRGRTYTDYAWPAAFGALYRRASLTTALALAAGLALFLALLVAWNGGLVHRPLAGDFYAVFPHNTLVAMFGSVFAFALLAMAIGARRFWRDIAAGDGPYRAPAEAVAEAAGNAAVLKFLDGGHGEGCNDVDDRFTLWRRRFHQITMYGFLLCFASTSVASLCHYVLRQPAPYPLLHPAVVLGTLGGVGLVVGPVGLFWLMRRRDPNQGDPTQRPLDRGFIALLLLTSVTGLALLAWRDSRWMGLLLAVHLGVVLALFATLPYGKFAHAVFRSAALLKHSLERRLPSPLALKDD